MLSSEHVVQINNRFLSHKYILTDLNFAEVVLFSISLWVLYKNDCYPHDLLGVKYLIRVDVWKSISQEQSVLGLQCSEHS